MINKMTCPSFYSPDFPSFLVQYRGDFLSELSKVDYACGYIINSKFACILMEAKNLQRVRRDMPSVSFIDFRSPCVLQSISSTNTSGISAVKENPYLNLNGNGVLIGIVDTGIDYLNKEFIAEDETSRIVTIWDQTVSESLNDSVPFGEVYSRDQINKAIEISTKNGDPYSIVPTKDENGHGTKVAGIIGARGYNNQFSGIAQNSEFAVVKLIESKSSKKYLETNNIPVTPIYNQTELLVGIEYLKNFAAKERKPIIICITIGSTISSHDGAGLVSRYLNQLSDQRGVYIITGMGNEGTSEGHASGNLKNIGDISQAELLLTKKLTYLDTYIWVRKPNRMSLNIISPSGEETKFIPPKINQIREVKFIYENTDCSIAFFFPDDITGNGVIFIKLSNIKPGIWKFQLKGDYIINGRYDIWLNPKLMLPDGTKFLNSDPFTTLCTPASSPRIISCSYYNSDLNSIAPESSKGFNVNGFIKPNFSAPGINILTTTVGNSITTFSGSSAAAAITTGLCALLVQWALVDNNDPTLTSAKLNGYLISGAKRFSNFNYPSPELGYGFLDIEGVFNAIGNKR